MMKPTTASAYLDALAAQLGANPETRRKWRERGRIAATWHARLLLAAQAENVQLPPAVFDRFTPPRKNGD